VKTADFSYTLPPELIAQVPARKRTESRLLCFNRQTGSRNHLRFSDLPDLIPAGDLLVINSSRVIPARLHPFGGDPKKGEILLVKALDGQRFEAMVRPGRKFRPGGVIDLFQGGRVTVEQVKPDGLRILQLHADPEVLDFFRTFGEMPLPPYISSRESSPDRYQTVFAGQEGSIAAPTAGLHFDQPLLEQLRGQGVLIEEIVLHVGLGTFKPMETELLSEHVMHEERFFLAPATTERILAVKKRGGRIWACGTTSIRALESAVLPDGSFRTGWQSTALFIQPGYQFQVTDRLITNFHLPRSTLLVLLAAFCGRETVLRLYDEAVALKYRFYSFGDAMVIL
jgi:S-adenosylmethionine:tRNA ribosyltransferase-isomerase